MSAAETKASRSGSPVAHWCLINRHFLIAALILAIATGGWSAVVHFLQWATLKEPVPWPVGVEVEAKTFRNLTLPTKFGLYYRRLETKDGIRTKAGPLDGEQILEESVMEQLEIGTARDKRNIAKRRSNWYVSRIYLDTRKNRAPGSALLWQLDVTQYTGGLDKVPHVPEFCVQAGGARLKGSTRLEFSAPGAREGWRRPAVRRVLYTRTNKGQTEQLVQYYTLSVNDEMVTNRLTVRRKLTYPWARHCYFAKIQFAPLGPVRDIDATDRAAEEFMKQFLPDVLRTLPTAQAIDRLNSPKQ